MHLLEQPIAFDQCDHFPEEKTQYISEITPLVSVCSDINRMEAKERGVVNSVSVLQKPSGHGRDLIRLVDQTNVAGVARYQSGGAPVH